MSAEGGYGWFIVGSYVLNMAFGIQLIQMMGLALKDVFKALDFTDSQGATIMTCTQAISMGLGVLAGPLIGMFGVRGVAMVGGLCTVVGLGLSSTATTYTEFILYFGILMATGMSLTYPSYIVALNVYFVARRTLATAVGLCLTGALSAATPHLISSVAGRFGARAGLLVLAGVAMQTLVGAALLRPRGHGQGRGKAGAGTRAKAALTEKEAVTEDADAAADAVIPMLDAADDEKPAADAAVEARSKLQPAPARAPARSVAGNFVAFLDLTLVRDPAFVVLVVGASLGLFADVNLVQFLPFILRDFSTSQVAVFMSVFGVTDTVCRMAAPALHRLCARPSRFMYAATLVALMAARTSLLFCRSYAAVMAAMATTGALRGVNVVFLQLAIPDNVPVSRMAAAQGLFLLCCGITFSLAGLAIGWLLAKTKDYAVILLVLVAINVVTLVLWGAEYAVKACRRRRKLAALPGE